MWANRHCRELCDQNSLCPCQTVLLTSTATESRRCLFLKVSQTNPLTSGPKAATDPSPAHRQSARCEKEGYVSITTTVRTKRVY